VICSGSRQPFAGSAVSARASSVIQREEREERRNQGLFAFFAYFFASFALTLFDA
jgi:hypothetical protein